MPLCRTGIPFCQFNEKEILINQLVMWWVKELKGIPANNYYEVYLINGLLSITRKNYEYGK
jgi:hypothetical protein